MQIVTLLDDGNLGIDSSILDVMVTVIVAVYKQGCVADHLTVHTEFLLHQYYSCDNSTILVPTVLFL